MFRRDDATPPTQSRFGVLPSLLPRFLAARSRPPTSRTVIIPGKDLRSTGRCAAKRQRWRAAPKPATLADGEVAKMKQAHDCCFCNSRTFGTS